MRIVNGIALIEGDSHICKWIEQAGRLDHDQNTLPFIEKYIKPGDTVIDAGAFVGDHTEFYRQRVGSDGVVFAFEPNQEAFECLEYNMKKYNNVNCLPYALSFEGNRRVSVNASSENKGQAYCYYEEYGVECMTIDSLNLKRCDFIKIDVEGFELDILSGAEQTIREFKPVMCIEINEGTLRRVRQNRYRIYGLLDDYGYTFKNIYPGHGLDLPMMDIICEATVRA